MLKINLKSILFLVLFAIPTTLLTLGILVILNSIVTGKELSFSGRLEIVFFSMVALSFVLNVFFQRKIINYSNNLIYENEMRIMGDFLDASLSQLEKIGFQRIYGIVEDLRMFVFLPGIISSTVISVMTLAICLVYFSLVSWVSALVVVSMIAVIAFIYIVLSKRVSKNVEQVRSLNDSYFKIVDDVLKGFKELKLSTTRITNLREKHLRTNRKSVRDGESYVSNYFLAINLFSQYGLFLVMGVVIFILPAFNWLNKAQVTSFVISLLFIRGPIIGLISMQSFYTKSFVANKRIAAFLKDLKAIKSEQKALTVAQPEQKMRELRFEGIAYKYESTSSDEAFALGPIDLTIHEGETIFIIGGNGSGKSTFINLLTGIYSPTKGKVYLNGREVPANPQAYRNNISAIFTDNHLFSANYENYSLENNKDYEHWLKVMELDGIVSSGNDAAARRKFSKGQGKRMAMIFAMLENRPVLVLDEWAADQDPYFRKYFYELLLPRLKKQGKTIIAVTHDDAYFRHADRIIKFDYGHVVKDIRPGRHMPDAKELWGA
jgi:multidrug/microcin transport system ATP-binding/permease protein